MTSIMKLHGDAMALVEQALACQRQGASAKMLFRRALELEEQAAALVEADFSLEPTRGILHRSAATLAMRCNEWRRAEKLIAAGLRGDPPEEIAEELRDVLETAHAMRHLEVRGVELSSVELQLAISGPRIAFGFAPRDEVMPRVEATEKILARRAEHRGQKSRIETFLSVPRAASYAMTIRVASKPEQLELGSKPVDMSAIISEVVDYLELYNQDKIEELRGRINNPEHFEVFLALANKMAPDGERVRQVGFSVVGTRGQDSLRKIQLRRRLNRVPHPTKKTLPETLEVTGIVKAADSTNRRIIKIESDSTSVETIYVPSDMYMDDIVRPYWGQLVTVRAQRSKRKFVLTEIDKVSTP